MYAEAIVILIGQAWAITNKCKPGIYQVSEYVRRFILKVTGKNFDELASVFYRVFAGCTALVILAIAQYLDPDGSGQIIKNASLFGLVDFQTDILWMNVFAYFALAVVVSTGSQLANRLISDFQNNKGLISAILKKIARIVSED